MAQDIRKLLQKHAPKNTTLTDGHEARFEARLSKGLPEKKTNHAFFWMKIAAITIVFVSIGYFGYEQLSKKDGVDTVIADTTTTEENATTQFTLGDISPDLKKVEDFYVTGINVQLASLQNTPENKELIDGYLLHLKDLDAEYSLLNKELNEVGPTEETITALIDNLKLRLELLFKLKNKLKELKNQENEQFNSIQS